MGNLKNAFGWNQIYLKICSCSSSLPLLLTMSRWFTVKCLALFLLWVALISNIKCTVPNAKIYWGLNVPVGLVAKFGTSCNFKPWHQYLEANSRHDQNLRQSQLSLFGPPFLHDLRHSFSNSLTVPWLEKGTLIYQVFSWCPGQGQDKWTRSVVFAWWAHKDWRASWKCQGS